MINKRLSLILMILIATTSAALAEADPMKSLFMFQKQMADKGNASAMMKMGLMYERGEGVNKSNDNAMDMYLKAKKAGHAKASAAIKRLKNINNKSANSKKLEAQKRQRALAAEKLKKQHEATATRQKAKQAANNKALREKQKKEKVAKAKQAKLKVAKEKAARAKVAAKAKAKAKANQAKNPKEGFKSDPCKGKAARLLSICK